MKLNRCFIAAAVSIVVLAGCGQEQEPQLEQSSSATVSTESTPTASPSENRSATPNVSSSPSEYSTGAETPVAESGTFETGVADDGRTTSLDEFLSSGGACFADYFPAGPLTEAATQEVQKYCASTGNASSTPIEKFFQTGGQCIADVWSSSIPYTDELHQKVIDYCAANNLGDWSHGIDPMDPNNYGGAQSQPAEKSTSTEAEEIAKCEALDINTAMSGDIQHCYMEYGVSVD